MALKDGGENTSVQSELGNALAWCSKFLFLLFSSRHFPPLVTNFTPK